MPKVNEVEFKVSFLWCFLLSNTIFKPSQFSYLRIVWIITNFFQGINYQPPVCSWLKWVLIIARYNAGLRRFFSNIKTEKTGAENKKLWRRDHPTIPPCSWNRLTKSLLASFLNNCEGAGNYFARLKRRKMSFLWHRNHLARRRILN